MNDQPVLELGAAADHAPNVACRICGTKPAPGAELGERGWTCSYCLQEDLFGDAPRPEQPELLSHERRQDDTGDHAARHV